jgi:nicotinamide riboside transporter PnuC
MIEWVFVALTVIATIANVKKLWWGFALYMATNAYWCVFNLLHGVHSQAVQYAIFFALATWGVWSWRKKRDLYEKKT